MWNGAAAPLAAAIQHAVIVETHDRGPWNIEVPATDEFPRQLLHHQQEKPGRKVADLRRGGNGYETESSYSSLWNKLFDMLERLDPEPTEEKVVCRDPTGLLLVHHRHLELLEKALNTMSHMGFHVLMPLYVYNRGINGHRPSQDYPLRNDMRSLLDYAILCERERCW
jgi:hypothetical protein